MSIGEWTPAGTEPATIDPAFLQYCLSLAENARQNTLAESLTEEQQSAHSHIMQLDESSWQTVVTDLSEPQLIDLIYFFTRAEKVFIGWEAGNKSPAIYLNRALKKRGGRLNKEDLMWIRDNTDNRFIPNGSL